MAVCVRVDLPARAVPPFRAAEPDRGRFDQDGGQCLGVVRFVQRAIPAVGDDLAIVGRRADEHQQPPGERVIYDTRLFVLVGYQGATGSAGTSASLPRPWLIDGVEWPRGSDG